ncbi:hypothetical protein MHYP_G00166520 [Metynnis hypsauchen]
MALYLLPRINNQAVKPTELEERWDRKNLPQQAEETGGNAACHWKRPAAAGHPQKPADPNSQGWRAARGEHVLLLESELEPLTAPPEVYTRGREKAAAGDWHSKISLI